MAEYGGDGPPKDLFQFAGMKSLIGEGPSSSPQTGSKGRLPPHNIEAERSVIGAMLVNNQMIDHVIETGLQAQHFYLDAHRKIYDVVLHLYEKRDPADMLTVSNLLKDRNWYESAGGMEKLTSLFDDAFAVGNVVHYAEIVRDKAVVRKLIEECSDIMHEGFDGVENVEEFLNRAETKVFGVANQNFESTVVELKKVLLANMSAIEDLALKDRDVTGLSTGFRDFDKVTTGLHPGQVMVLAARPGMGKTSWFISALQAAALKQKAVVALFSLEMSKEEIGFRFLSGLARIDSRKLKTGKLSEQDWRKLAESADILCKSKIFIDDSGGLTAMDIRARSRRLKQKERQLDLIVVDYLQLMKGSRGSKGGEQSREREISEISRNLKELAKELGVPIIALSQLNRGVEQRQDKRPNLSDLRESGAIEQDADLVCFIHREDYYNRETENRGIAEFIVAKNRAGETATVRMAWLGQYTLFADLAPGEGGMPSDPGRPEKGDITL